MKVKHSTAALLAVAGALAIAVPAAAHPGKGGTSTGGKSSTHTKRCAPHKRAYVVSGVILDGGGMTLNSDGTWSGTVTYTVTHHNHYAKNDPGTATVTNVKVKFDDGATAFSTGNRIKLIGKIEWVRTTGHNVCPSPGAQGSPVVRALVVSPAAS